MNVCTSTPWRTFFLVACLGCQALPGTAQERHVRTNITERGGPASGNYYCVPTYLFGTQEGDYIDGVRLGTIQQLETGGSPGPSYSDYFFAGSNTVTRLAPSVEYDLVVTSGPIASMYYAWIDFNGNGEFDTAEFLGDQQSGGQFEEVTISFTVPTGAQIGYTGLRVRCIDIFTPTPDPCGVYDLGETEDYAVLIDDGAPCTPLHTEGTSEGDFIAGVQIGSLQDGTGTTGSPAYTPPRRSVHLAPGVAYDIEFSSGAYEADLYKAWADWDQDGVWNETDELIGEFHSTTAFEPHTWTFTVPTDAWGWVRLRMKCADANTMSACDDYEFGETRDYMLVIDHPLLPCFTYNYIGANNGLGMDQVAVNGSVITNPAALPNHLITGSDPVVHVLPGSVLNVDVTGNGSNEGNLVVGYIDLNNDLDFDDPNETGPYINGTAANEVMDFALNVPVGTAPGGHFVRIASYGEGFEFVNGCYDPAEGQVIDLLIIVDGTALPCIPGSVNWTSEGVFIDGVELGTISNLNTGARYGAVYNDYTTQSTDVLGGQSYDLNVFNGENVGSYYHAWVDLNDDGDFGDVDEYMGGEILLETNSAVGLVIDIPMNTPLGEKRMRVRCTENEGATPCADSNSGETEDYTVVVTGTTGVQPHGALACNAVVAADGNSIMVTWSAVHGATTITLIDATGRTVATTATGTTSALLPTGHLAEGAYTIVLDNGGQRSVLRSILAR
ncbi:MAG TPA: GEVED domain-containing protein [Flavobacteriales bacterium]|nr:GEVED domain-containing protein [Flavobacteriales bacterium]